MTRDEIFEIWAPPGAPWSGWVKPAPFAHLPREQPANVDPVAPTQFPWIPPPAGNSAIVVELPGALSVNYGLALAAIGYCPVPLFNAIPPPTPDGIAVVNVAPTLTALQNGAEIRRSAHLPADAPPAFLTDFDRQATHNPPLPGTFDNRSVVFVTDFPSAARLTGYGITSALLVRESASGLGDDLRLALQMWQKEGITLTAKWLSESNGPVPLRLPRPSWLAGLRHRLRVFFGFRRNPSGEFGEFIPHAAGG
jgi:hypothetical protein